MARIKTGSIVSDISGKVGSEIYSRNKGGPYVKTWAAPVIPFSTFRDDARDLLAAANIAWTVLPELSKTSWSFFSEQFLKSSFVSGSKSIDPRAVFIGNFLNQSYVGLSAGPTPIFPSSPGFTGFDIDLGATPNPLLQINAPSSNANFRVKWSASFPVSNSIRSVNTIPLYNFGYSNFDPAATYDFSSDYLNRFGTLPLQPLSRLFFKAEVIHLQSGFVVGSFISNAVFLGTETPFQAGLTTIGIASAGGVRSYASAFTADFDGYINSVGAYCTAQSADAVVAIYSSSGNNPNLLLGESLPFSAPSPLSWQLKNLILPVGIVSGQKYWMAISSASLAFTRYNGLSGAGRRSTVGGAPAPAVWTENNIQNWQFSIYCNGFYFV